MYFWKLNKLEDDLKVGLSEKEDMKYLIASMIVFAIGTMPLISNPNIYNYIIGFSMIAFVIIEVLILYKTNKGNTGKNFLSRYISIGLVVLIRTLIFIMIPLFVIYIYVNVSFLGNPDLISYNILDVILNIVYGLGYLYFQMQSFKRINI